MDLIYPASDGLRWSGGKTVSQSVGYEVLGLELGCLSLFSNSLSGFGKTSRAFFLSNPYFHNSVLY